MISLNCTMSLSWKLPRYLVRYEFTDDNVVIIYSYVYDLLILKNNMKEAYMILGTVDVVLVIKVEKMLLNFDHLKFNRANISYDSSNKILKSLMLCIIQSHIKLLLLTKTKCL